MAICGRAESQHRTDLVDKRAVTPAADRQKFPRQPEKKLDDRCNHEGRDRAAGGRKGNNRIVADPVLIEGGNDTKCAPDKEGEYQGRRTELDGDWQTTGEQLCHSEVGQVIAGPEIAVQNVLHVVDVLKPKRVIETELRFEIGFDFRAQATLLIERSAGSNTDQKKRDRYDHEKCRNGGQKPP